jgi:anti-repressor protein
MPMQRYLEMGLFEVTKGTRSGNGGVMHTTRTTKITPKGQQYFINKFIHS